MVGFAETPKDAQVLVNNRVLLSAEEKGMVTAPLFPPCIISSQVESDKPAAASLLLLVWQPCVAQVVKINLEILAG